MGSAEYDECVNDVCKEIDLRCKVTIEDWAQMVTDYKAEQRRAERPRARPARVETRAPRALRSVMDKVASRT